MDTISNILIVDDDPKVRKTLSDILRKKGYVPITAATGKEALDKVNDEIPQVALIDLKLDDISGLEVMKQIKECCPDTDCIVLTGYASQESAIEAVNLGAYFYMQKPYDMEQLLITIRRAIEKREAEEALRETEVIYRLLIDNAANPITIYSDYGALLLMNVTAAANLGGSPNDFVGKSIYEIHPDIADVSMERIRQVFDTGKGIELENMWELPSGNRWFWSNFQPVRDASGRIFAVEIVSYDITERKQMEEALRKSEGHYRLLAENVTDVIWTMDMNLRFTYISPSVELMRGYSVEETMAQTFEETLTPASFEIAMKAYAEELAIEEMEQKDLSRSLTLELEYYCKDGSTVWVESKVTGLRDPDDRLVGILGITRNITERKLAEEALRQSEERLKTIMDSIQAGIVVIDAVTHTIFDANPAAIKMISAPKEEIISHVCHKYICPMEKGKCPITDLGKKIDNSERILLKVNGEEVPILKTATPIMLGGKEYLLESFIDITEKKNFEAQFQQAQRMEAIGTLAGGIAHDFNNILMGIQGNASLTLLGKTSEHPDYERLKNIEQGVQSGADLTKQLLAFAIGGKYEVRPTNLNELIKNQNRMFGRTKKEITVRGNYEENLWTVEVDQGQINQVFLNLYVNAWQAMPGGGDLFIQPENVTLDENYTKPFGLEPGRYVKISITDTGVGMDEATQQRIFDPFFTTKEMGRGTGLGLASVYGIIKNHGGIINVYSEKGKGTTFNIYLPASEKEVIEEKGVVGEVLKGIETVLLVDDEDIIIDVGKKMLIALGYKVLIARSGKETIEIVRKAPQWSRLRTPQGKHRAKSKAEEGKERHAPGAMPSAPDLVILDMIMPEMSGGDTYDRLKKINPNIKVLLSSGYSINGQAKEILERGCNGFIQKPFNMRQFSQKIREVLDTVRIEH